ncbi:MAG: hypothetical protein JWO20_151 [Candidatus Angelobacter sp.]|jgi:uncharacterized protein (DUF885 family)|nr:hypothetical protein [Candidatus Angelobacter sp.]
MITKGLVRNLFCLCIGFAILAGAPSLSLGSSSDRVGKAHQKPATKPNPQAAVDALHNLFDADWEYTMQQNPTYASYLGDRRWNDKWEDVSLGNLQRQNQHTQENLNKLTAIDHALLPLSEQLNYDLFKKKNEDDAQEFNFKSYLMPVDAQKGGIQTADTIAENLRFDTVKDYEDWIARMNALPVYMDQTIALMQEGLRTGVKPPKVIMTRVAGQIDKQIVPPEDSGFYLPFKRFPRSISDADQKRLSDSARTAIANSVVPSFRKFKEFFASEYLPHCYDQVGAWQLPNGDAYYAFEVRKQTTTNMTPEEIHTLGLSEVKRIRAEMETIKDKTGFKGTMPEFFVFLRTDPQFFYKTGDELLEASRANAKRIDPLLIKEFKLLPRIPYGVTPIPASSAPDQTTAYYEPPAADGSRPGMYKVNLYKPETRPKWEMMALTLHEAVPGHHLQIALAYELSGDIPKFRKYAYYTAFVEGWGLYSEFLGDEMGLYDNPYSKFGQLTYEMWRAVRLVVDTGMHYKHWTRQQSIDYFMQNAAKTENDVTNEVDRYIGWPGQALAYKIGELKIKQLRAKAKQEFADRFDVRDFHNIVLGSGSLPLDILERNVNIWIEANCPRACELPPELRGPPKKKASVVQKKPVQKK